MTIKARIPVVITGALAATTLAGVAAFASPAAPVDMGDQSSHMAELDSETLDDMATMMDGADTIGEMHRQMADNGMPIGQMHRQMHPQMGGELGEIHRSMAPRSGVPGEPS